MKSALLLSFLMPALGLSSDPPAAPEPAAVEKAADKSFTLQVLAFNEKPASKGETAGAEMDITARLKKRMKMKFKTTVQEHGRILVEFPALTPEQAAQARRLMEKPGRLDLRPLGPEGVAPVGKDDTAIKPGFVKLPFMDSLSSKAEKAPAEEKYLWVTNRWNLLPRGSVRACAQRVTGTTHNTVGIRLDKDTGEVIRKLSAAHVGEPLAIIIDGEVVSAPTVQAEFGAHFQISGDYDAEDVEDFAVILNHPLESAVRIVEPGIPALPQNN